MTSTPTHLQEKAEYFNSFTFNIKNSRTHFKVYIVWEWNEALRHLKRLYSLGMEQSLAFCFCLITVQVKGAID